jgi:hypothetical protein
MVQDWRSQPSPPQLHQYPSHSHSHSQPLQSQQSQTHHLPQQPSHNSHHPSSYHTQHKHQLPHRRLSDVRTSGPFTLNHSGTSNSPRHPASDAYGVGGGAMNSTSAVMKRSPSHSPPISYSLGRPLNAAPSNGSSTTAPTRPLGIGQAHLSGGLGDAHAHALSSGTAGGGNHSAGGRDTRGAPSGSGASALPGGPGMPPKGGSSSALDAGLALQPQPPAQAGPGKYSSGSTSRGDVGHGERAPRWPHMGGGDAVAGGGGYGSTGGAGMAGEGKLLSGTPSGSGSGAVGGVAGAGGGGSAGQRGLAGLGDGIQSLPSLKASGLLDSWGAASRAVGAGGGASDASQKQALNGTPQQHTTPRRTTSTSGNMHLTILAASSDVAELRPATTLSMPVGLQWLANESR